MSHGVGEGGRASAAHEPQVSAARQRGRPGPFPCPAPEEPPPPLEGRCAAGAGGDSHRRGAG